MITDGIYAYLSSHATITALVGTRIYGCKLPQNPVLPCITFRVTSAEPVGANTGKASVDRTSIQFDIFSETYEGGRTIANSLRRNALEGYVGLMGSHTIQQVVVVNPGIDDFDNTPQDFRVIAEYEFRHTL